MSTYTKILLVVSIITNCHIVWVKEVIFEAIIVDQKNVNNQKVANLKKFNKKTPFYLYEKNAVVLGYTTAKIAQEVMSMLFSREDKIAHMSPTLPASSPVVAHIKVISEVVSLEDAQKLLQDAWVIGEVFSLVNDQGLVLKKQCYLLVSKKEGTSAAQITILLSALTAALQGPK